MINIYEKFKMFTHIDIFIIIVLAFIVISVWNKSQYEHLTTISNESIQSLSSMYNTSQLTTTNMTCTNLASTGNSSMGTISVSGSSTFGKDVNVTGLLTTVGDASIGGKVITNNLATTAGALNMVGTDTINMTGTNGINLKNNTAVTGNMTVSGKFYSPGSTISAYLLDLNGSTFPIFGSMSDLNTISASRNDDWWVVMPGYKIVIYDNIGYSGKTYTIDNTGSATPAYSRKKTSGNNYDVNNARSVKVYGITGNELPAMRVL